MRQITELFGTILGYFYGCTGDLGIAIVCLTVAVRLCLLPFSLRQRRSMENQQANPAGCLLLLVQFPIMIGLYQSIAAGVTEQAGTRLLPWVGSLLARDPYGILPVLTVLVQLLPQVCPYIAFFDSLKLPKPSAGMLLPTAAVTLLICFPLPSGVALYYLTSNLCAALEQGGWNVAKALRAASA